MGRAPPGIEFWVGVLFGSIIGAAGPLLLMAGPSIEHLLVTLVSVVFSAASMGASAYIIVNGGKTA